MPGGVGEPGSVGEKVSAPHRQLPTVCLCVHSMFLWCWIRNFAGRAMMVTLETRGPSDSLVLLWAELPPFLLPSSSCSSFPCLFIAYQLICITVRVLKGMSVRRGTLAFLELLGLLDLEEYREKMDLKAPLWVIHFFLVIPHSWWVLTLFFFFSTGSQWISWRSWPPWRTRWQCQ